MKRHLSDVLKVLDAANEAAALFMILTTVVVVFLAALSRYVFKNPLPWTEEVARFAFIWLAFIGISIAERKKVHFRITYFVNKISSRKKKIIWYLNEILIVIALFLLFYEGIKFARMGAQGVSAVLELPLDYIYVALPVAFGLTIINRIRNTVESILKGQENYFDIVTTE